MVDNRYATALVIGSVLSLLATVYLSVAVGTQHWYEYNTPEVNWTTHGDPIFTMNGTRALWWRCILVASSSHWYKTPDGNKMETRCSSFSLSEQLSLKTKPGKNEQEEEDLLRTYLWRCQFLLPLVSLALVFLSGLVGVCACLCRSFTPTFFCGSAPSSCRSVFFGHRLLFSGWGGLAPPVLPSARRGGGHLGLVSLPRPHILPSSDDGSSSVPVGGQKSSQELHPHDCLQGSIEERASQSYTFKQLTGLYTSSEHGFWLGEDVNVMKGAFLSHL